MKKVENIAALRRWVGSCRRGGEPIILVPTMGCLHEGHLSLVRKAQNLAGSEGRVAVSIYINPTQFGPGEDLKRYPRNLRRDLRLCRQEGVDLVFAPRSGEMYPLDQGEPFTTYVRETELSRSMEGRTRPTHFEGVTTIVAKLFNLFQPDVAVFGGKDFQQAAIVRRMVRDLNFPVKLVVAPTVREKDGLALSSRNRYLTDDQREQAALLYGLIREARRLVRERPSGRPWTSNALKRRLEGLTAGHDQVKLDYLDFFDPKSLHPVKRVIRGTQLAVAMYVGRTRLIDNGRL